MSMRVPSGFFGEQFLSERIAPSYSLFQDNSVQDLFSVTPSTMPETDFFSVIPAFWFENLFKKPDPPMNLSGLANTLTGVQTTDPDDALDLLYSREVLVSDESLQNDIDVSYRKAKKDDRVYSWEVVTPRYRRPYSYCRDECACLCESIGKQVASKFPGLKVFSVRMNSSVGVYAFIGDSKRRASYDYHVALALIDEEGRIGMIDPIIYERASVVSFEDWWGRFDHAETSYGFRISQFINEAT